MTRWQPRPSGKGLGLSSLSAGGDCVAVVSVVGNGGGAAEDERDGDEEEEEEMEEEEGRVTCWKVEVSSLIASPSLPSSSPAAPSSSS